MIFNKGSRPQYGETVYVAEVNGTGKVNLTHKISDLMQKFFLRVAWEGSVPNEIFPNSWNYAKLVELGNSHSGCI